TEPVAREFLGLAMPTHVTTAERRSLLAGGLGWMLDSMDVMLYSMVLARLMTDLGMSKTTAGYLNSLTLLSSALGGIAFGFLADRRDAGGCRHCDSLADARMASRFLCRPAAGHRGILGLAVRSGTGVVEVARFSRRRSCKNTPAARPSSERFDRDDDERLYDV